MYLLGVAVFPVGIGVFASGLLVLSVTRLSASRRLAELWRQHERRFSEAALRERKLKEELRGACAVQAGLAKALMETRDALTDSDRRLADLEQQSHQFLMTAAAEARITASGTSDDAGVDLPGLAPPKLPAPRGGRPDDLTAILGIGRGTAELLNDIGIYHIEQIAGWDLPQIAHVEALMAWDEGPISRDGWVRQAQAIDKPKLTEFSEVEDAAEFD